MTIYYDSSVTPALPTTHIRVMLIHLSIYVRPLVTPAPPTLHQGRDKMPAYWLGAFSNPSALFALLRLESYKSSSNSNNCNFEMIPLQTEITARDKDHVSCYGYHINYCILLFILYEQFLYDSYSYQYSCYYYYSYCYSDRCCFSYSCCYSYTYCYGDSIDIGFIIVFINSNILVNNFIAFFFQINFSFLFS